MHPFSSKFIQLIQTFDDEALKSFERWLKSPWCNTNKNLVKLYEVLRKYHPEYENPSRLSKEKLFKKVLPNGKYSVRRMNNLLSEGYLAAKKFLVHYRFAKEERFQNYIWFSELQDRYLEDWFFKETEQEIKRLNERSVKEWEDHLALFILHRNIYHHPTAGPRMRQGNLLIEEMDKQLNHTYLLEMGAIIVEKMSRSGIIRDEQHDLDGALGLWLKATENYTEPVFQLYRLRMNYKTENFLEQYHKLRTLLLQEFDYLNKKEQKLHLLYILNDTIRLIRKGVLDITDTLVFYKLGLKEGILMHKGRLTQNTYTTIVSASNTQKDFSYTRHFIENYTKTLDEKVQEDGYCWAQAHTAYWQNDLKGSIDYLITHEFNSYYFKLIGRMLTVQVYFELYLQDDSYYDFLFSYFNAYEKWLQRDKTYAKSSHQSFIRFVQLSRILARLYSELHFEADRVSRLLDEELNVQAMNWLKKQQIKVLELRSH